MKLEKINKVAKKLGLCNDDLIPYGFYKAKIEPRLPKKGEHKEKLVLVTAITPTKAGEGKTTTSIALAEALDLLGANCCLALREPSLGPVFGIKGGATGGGKVTVEPQEDINLHFNGDLHALTSSINLVAACLDNSIYQGNPLNIDSSKVVYKRALDMNDRALREITIGQGPLNSKGKPLNGIERKDGFVITVAHEMMAIMCLASSEEDFKKRLANIIVAYTYEDKPVTIGDLRITNAVMKLMREALKPNLVQTSSHTPALIHGGPFANIAHGCNSIIATKTALSLADIVVTEAGFGADLGAEKFLDIKCQEANLKPSLVVMVATIRALKLHGGADPEHLDEENIDALKKGLPNLERHMENIAKFGLEAIVNINSFASDTLEEEKVLEEWCAAHHYPYAMNNAYAKGAKGAVDLARLVLDHLFIKGLSFNNYHPIYTREMPVKDKIETICKEIYRASEVIYSEQAMQDLEKIHQLGFDDFYVCMAKTPMSFSDKAKLVGAPDNFAIHVKNIEIAAGAKFIIPITGSITRMPGLPLVPAAVKMEDE